MFNRRDIWLINPDRAAPYFAKQMGENAGSGESEREGVLAEIHLAGPLAKGLWIEGYGGTSSSAARGAVNAAAADPTVEGIFLVVDSPGGEVAGTEELANAIAAAARVKPVHAHIDDLGASAAIWSIAGASTITANSTATVGSIGAMAMIPDTSGAWESMGVKWHVVKSGEAKGGPIPEAGISDDDLAPLQERVDFIAGQFRDTLADHRGMSAEQLETVADGRTYSADRAKELGIIDEVMSATMSASHLIAAVAELRTRRRAVRRR